MFVRGFHLPLSWFEHQFADLWSKEEIRRRVVQSAGGMELKMVGDVKSLLGTHAIVVQWRVEMAGR